MSETLCTKKRSKGYYGAPATKRKRCGRLHYDLSVGMKGILITTNASENLCVSEAYHLLNEYGDKLYGPELSEERECDVNSHDIEQAIAKEMEDLKKSVTEKRFQAMNSGVKNVVFIQCKDPVDPCELVHYLFTEAMKEQKRKSRYCQRMIPVSLVCRATEQDIKKHASSVLEPHFYSGLQMKKFLVNYKTRNNTSMDRDSVIGLVASLVKKNNELDHIVDLKNPDLVVNVDIIKNLCCLSVVKDFVAFKKYNFHSIVESDNNAVIFVPLSKVEQQTSTAEKYAENVQGCEQSLCTQSDTVICDVDGRAAMYSQNSTIEHCTVDTKACHSDQSGADS